MSIKTILLHLANDDHHAQRLAVAVRLARKFEAFLDFLHIVPVRSEGGEQGEGHSADLEHKVRVACRNASYALTVIEGDPLERMVERAAFADLLILSQMEIEAAEGGADQMPERLALRMPGPLLVLPSNGDHDSLGRHILVAWHNSRTSGRAVRDALPFLKRAERVTLLSIDPPGLGGEGDSRELGEDLSVFLDRHGIQNLNLVNISTDDPASDAILRLAEENECDLIVLGASGHSRLRSLVMGNVTRSVLEQTRVPVLLSH
ncbi:Universal stress protein UspA [uncultured Gammaproteobacteria bacterium]